MHVLGFYHEQMKSDRADHITVNLDNIIPAKRRQFRIHPEQDDLGYGYDIRSIMQYRRRSAGIKDVVTEDGRVIPRETMTPVDPTVIELGNGRNGGLTPTDALQLNERYCNEPKINLNGADLITLIERWMRIFERYVNDEFADQLQLHLDKIYPGFNFLVGSSDVLESSNDNAASGNCIRVANHDRNALVCYTRKQPGKRLKRKKKRKVKSTIKRAVNRQLCAAGARNILDMAVEAIKTDSNQKVAGIYVLLFRYNLETDWSEGARSIRVNFKCKDTRYIGSVSVLFK